MIPHAGNIVQLLSKYNILAGKVRDEEVWQEQ